MIWGICVSPSFILPGITYAPVVYLAQHWCPGNYGDVWEYKTMPQSRTWGSLCLFSQEEAVILGPPGRAQGTASRPGSDQARKWVGGAAFQGPCGTGRASAAGFSEGDGGPAGETAEPRDSGVSGSQEVPGNVRDNWAGRHSVTDPQGD